LRFCSDAKQTERACIAPVAFPRHSTPSRKYRQREQYQRVFNERKRPIRRLWIRNGRFHAVDLVDHQTGSKNLRRAPLENAAMTAPT
jgi:hypothetical protein